MDVVDFKGGGKRSGMIVAGTVPFQAGSAYRLSLSLIDYM